MELSGSSGARARMVPADGGGWFVAAGLERPPEGHVYQLWLVNDGRTTSAGTFEAVGGVVGLEIDQPLEGVDGVAVTIEPDGGSEQPTGARVLSS
jgi:anti-sigma-K factor RskA